MTSVSAKAVDLKKNSISKQGNGILTSPTGTTEKVASPKSALSKSPTTPKLPSKTSPLKNGSDSSKVNGSSAKKMDTNSPPKVVRTPSAKSMSPPASKTNKVATSKATSDHDNSQGDVIHVKNDSNPENGDIHSNGNFNVDNTIESELEENHFAAESSEAVNEKEQETVSQNGGNVSTETVQGDSFSIKDKFSLTADVQHCASGDQITTCEKSEIQQSGELCKKEPESNPTSEETKIEELVAEKDEKTTVNAEPNSCPTEQTEGSPISSTTDCSECSVETAKLVTDDKVTKNSLRMKVWEHLEKNELVLFPRPCTGRIPNFKGAPAAAERLTTLDVFKNSKIIKVNPDKAQEMVRFHILSFGKRLLVPIPRLREGLFQAVIPPAEASKHQLLEASQRYGMKRWSKPVESSDNVLIDMIVLGSVIVDKKGHRIGKGEGFADLEFAMLTKLKAINEHTVIVTTVHDDQIYDELPEHLFSAYDVPVDWIVTPTQVIEVANKLPRPAGIIWNILSKRRILEIPLLQKLQEEEQSNGVECNLKEVDSDVEEKPFVQRFTRRRQYNKYSRSTGDPLRDNKMYPSSPPTQPTYFDRPRRFFQPPPNRVNNYGPPPAIRHNYVPPQRRMYYQEPPMYNGRDQQFTRETRARSQNRNNNNNRSMGKRPQSMDRDHNDQRNRSRSANRSKSMNRAVGIRLQPNVQLQSNHRQPGNNHHNMSMRTVTRSVEVQTVDKKPRASRTYLKRKRTPIEFSLRLKNIGMGVRVRDLKVALNERGIKPRVIIWRGGYNGSASLHFVKTGGKQDNQPLNVDDVIKKLQDLPLPPKDKKSLVVEAIQSNKIDGNEVSEQSEKTIIVPTIVAV